MIWKVPRVQPCHLEKDKSIGHRSDRNWTQKVQTKLSCWSVLMTLCHKLFGRDISWEVRVDNRSTTMLIENNGRVSSRKRRCHINIPYFFVADRVQSNEVTMEYSPTGEMTGDFFTKPLQGVLFKKFRNDILNCAWISDDNIMILLYKMSLTSQECVEKRL